VSRYRRRVAQRAVPGRVEPCKFGVDVDGDGAEKAGGVRLCRGDVGEQLRIDSTGPTVQIVEGQAEIFRWPRW
jgi:hypothetical protein